MKFDVFDSKAFSFNYTKDIDMLTAPTTEHVDSLASRIHSVVSLLNKSPKIRYHDIEDSGISISSHVALRLQERLGMPTQIYSDMELVVADRCFDLLTPLIHCLSYRSAIQDLLKTDRNKYIILISVYVSENHFVSIFEQDPIYRRIRHEDVAQVGIILDQLNDLPPALSSLLGKPLDEIPTTNSIIDHRTIFLALNKLIEKFDFETLLGCEEVLVRSGPLKGNTAKFEEIRNKITEILNSTQISEESKLRLLMLASLRFPNDDFEMPGWDTPFFNAVRGIAALNLDSVSDSSANVNLNPYSSNQTNADTADAEHSSIYEPAIKSQLELFVHGNSKWPCTLDLLFKENQDQSLILFFIVGGITTFEIQCVHELASLFSREIIVGSTSIIVPDDFCRSVCKFGAKESTRVRLESVSEDISSLKQRFMNLSREHNPPTNVPILRSNLNIAEVSSVTINKLPVDSPTVSSPGDNFGTLENSNHRSSTGLQVVNLADGPQMVSPSVAHRYNMEEEVITPEFAALKLFVVNNDFLVPDNSEPEQVGELRDPTIVRRQPGTDGLLLAARFRELAKQTLMEKDSVTMNNTGSIPAQSGEDIGPFHIPKRMHVPSGVVRLPDQPGRNSPHSTQLGPVMMNSQQGRILEDQTSRPQYPSPSPSSGSYSGISYSPQGTVF